MYKFNFNLTYIKVKFVSIFSSHILFSLISFTDLPHILLKKTKSTIKQIIWYFPLNFHQFRVVVMFDDPFKGQKYISTLDKVKYYNIYSNLR